VIRDELHAIAMAKPGATHMVLWGGSDVYKVGGKVFATSGLGSAGVSFKVSQVGFAVLTDDGPGRQAPYFAKGDWANLDLGDLTPDEAEGWIGGAYDMVVAKLTRAARKELGL
jgi:predicted DNA-binding protein (MmcQ/YjbR family)